LPPFGIGLCKGPPSLRQSELALLSTALPIAMFGGGISGCRRCRYRGPCPVRAIIRFASAYSSRFFISQGVAAVQISTLGTGTKNVSSEPATKAAVAGNRLILIWICRRYPLRYLKGRGVCGPSEADCSRHSYGSAFTFTSGQCFSIPADPTRGGRKNEYVQLLDRELR